ncbi:MAG: hypothetical protein GC159_11290 [Phycisphaera sp.]|nr:hypothetical protein [Phycisphaera sp.]
MQGMNTGPYGSQRERGVILVIFLLAIFLLAALVMFVINTGQQVNNRISAQNNADASAKAASVWAARTLNTVAANNVEMARYAALVPVLHTMPRTTDYSLRESVAWRNRLAEQLNTGTGNSPKALYDIVNNTLTIMLGDFDTQIQDLTTVNDLFQQVNVDEMTRYNTGGYLWRAMTALDELNQGLTDEFPSMVQVAGVEGGHANFRDESDAGITLLPLRPEIPVQRGHFDDLERPARMGMLPEDEDDPLIRRGPWDAVYGWRDRLGHWEGGTYVPGSDSGGGGGAGRDVPIGGGPGGGDGQWVGREWIPYAYRTYGPLTWLKRRVSCYVARNLDLTRYDWYHRRMTDATLALIWPDPLDPGYLDNQGYEVWYHGGCSHDGRMINRGWRRDILNPEWVTNFDEAVAIADARTPPIKETAFFVVEIKSKYAMDDAKFLTPGTWQLVDNLNGRMSVQSGWRDPRRWRAEQTADYVWRDNWEYQVFWDRSIGIDPIIIGTNDDGSPIYQPQPVYRVDHFAFAGINTGNADDLDNPYEGFDPSADDAPSPMRLRHDQVEQDDLDTRRQYLSYMAVAYRHDKPQAWAARFRGGRPSPYLFSIAQAKVFNNHSWDLWTQMWRAELEPVNSYDDWVDGMSSQMGEASDVRDADDHEAVLKYLEATRGLATPMLQH